LALHRIVLLTILVPWWGRTFQLTATNFSSWASRCGVTYEHTQQAVAQAEKKIDAASKNVIELETDDEQE